MVARRSDGSGLRHSVSNSYHQYVISTMFLMHDQVGFMCGGSSSLHTYIHVEIFSDLDSFSKDEDVLHEGGKLPHVAQFGE